MKDRIGNELANGDKVLVALPEAQIFGFVSQIEDAGLIATPGRRSGTEHIPGRILVSCVIALPLTEEVGRVLQVVKVYDADAKSREEKAERVQ